ncbi:hypothetical protein [Natronorubrum aibiense]|uniref:hypothetical protein n=1 Tax=Natronorubrum aibiense TaxID=348826 RepID=UPI001386D0C7|nr:hypothetical protein [Natronorubrum aibiense]
MNDNISRRRFLGTSAAVAGISITGLGNFHSASAASDEVHGFEASEIAGETATLPYRLFKLVARRIPRATMPGEEADNRPDKNQ